MPSKFSSREVWIRVSGGTPSQQNHLSMRGLVSLLDRSWPKDDDNVGVQLPDHLIYSILLKLPNKSLVKFLALSKLWKETVTSRRFCVDRKMTSPELMVTNIMCARFNWKRKKKSIYMPIRYRAVTVNLNPW